MRIFKTVGEHWTLAHAEYFTPEQYRWLPGFIFNLTGIHGIDAYCEVFRHVNKMAYEEMIYMANKEKE